MIVEITKDSSKHGIAFPLVGEHYKAKNYAYDSDKVTLIYQVNPNTGEKLEEQHYECSDADPLVNEYKYNVRVVSR
jgi:hypothetical protein